ncbi:MAG: hypothetical protein ACFE9L_06755 [Candidatus Hodarchaeota archaeon]
MKNIVEVSPDEFKLINMVNIESKHLAFVREVVCSGNTPMNVWGDNNEQSTSILCGIKDGVVMISKSKTK